MILALWLPYLVGLALTLIIEALLRPSVAPFWRRPGATSVVHLGSWSLLFGVFLLVLQRPWFALVFITSLQMVVVQSSNTKSRTLREPFICQDFEYFIDAIRHPRLYVPFFGIGLAIAASSAGALAIAGFLVFEQALPGTHGLTAFIIAIAALLLIASGLLALGLRGLPAPTLAPQHDLERFGLFSALWAYGLRARQPLDADRLARRFELPPASTLDPTRLPNVVAVQSESFFDPRRWSSALPRDLLPNFDALSRDALVHGPLTVPVWGANTVRTEAGFLAGLSGEELGIHRFNPYRQLTHLQVPNLVASLKSLGYRCVCVHPYPASFYLRDRVMPQLGFDDFIDISAFSDEQRDGQYISDLAVADRVGRLLEESDNGPLFVFVITMENHGPLHLERPVPDDAPALPTDLIGPDASRHDDLRIYLRHLRNADDMIKALRQHLAPSSKRHSRHGMLCWYGDHVPIMTDIYQRLGEPDGNTSYAIWSSRSAGARKAQAVHPRPMTVETLGQRLLRTVIAEASRETQPNMTRERQAVAGQPQNPQEQE